MTSGGTGAVMNQETKNDKWFFCLRPRPRASMRLFCFPFGGGGASVFHSWSDAMGEDIEVRAAQLPGRETRYSEPRASDLPYLVRNIVQALEAYQDKPFAMFGYSLGSLLAFEVCRELRRLDMRMPEHLYFAAFFAPHLPPAHPPISHLADEEFAERVEYYYQPGEAWYNLELREFLMPVLRDDIALYEGYVYEHDEPLESPIDVFAGAQDRSIPLELMQPWSEQTRSRVKHHVFEGGHFFIDQSVAEIQGLVSSSLNQRL